MEYLLLSIILLFFTLIFYLSLKPNPPMIIPDDQHRPLTHPYPILGHLPQFIKNRHRFSDWITDSLAATPTSTLTFTRPGLRGIITANPSNVEHILRANFHNYPKGPRFTSLLQDFLGHGIFNVDGPLWLAQRKPASYEFNTRSLRTFALANLHHHTIPRLISLLSKSASHAQLIDLQDLFQRLAFASVCNVAFGVDVAASELSSAFAAAFEDAAILSAGRFRYALPCLWKLKRFLNAGSERRLREAISTVHDFAMQIIRSRKKDTSTPPRAEEDLLSRFIDGSEEFLRDVVISFVLAGRDTTSAALTWFFWLVTSRPEVENRILAEIRSIRGNNPLQEAFGFEEMRKMHYLHASITEAMRLYPPVPVNTTACMEDDVLPDGTEVKRGWFASYNAYAMGRMESVWGPDCMEYRPDRWLDEGGLFRPESPFNFPVFHAGPRMCLGKEMAYIQMKSIAACLIERFEVDVQDVDTCPEQMVSLTLRMKRGLPVRVRERQTVGLAGWMDPIS